MSVKISSLNELLLYVRLGLSFKFLISFSNSFSRLKKTQKPANMADMGQEW